MNKTVETLVISGNAKPLDIEALKAIYGAAATVRIANNADELVSIIISYVSIRRLVIATHGSEGDIIIRGVHTAIKRLAASLRDSRSRPRVTESAIFDGCNVAGEAESLAMFLEAVSAPKVVAFATSRLWWHDDYVIPKGADAALLADLKKRYEFYKTYLVAGQASWESLVKSGGRTRIWYEAFSRTERTRPITEADKRVTRPRSSLEIKRVSLKNVKALAADTSRVAGPLLQVEIVAQ